ncbi:hypothetical protein T484DRAFT_1748321 [Baffinella frigidus]|jgi:hypothetical protein|nr:hypothetical protein T484DRAFT_1748321 [Cryptophyta sp. CCMP2293]
MTTEAQNRLLCSFGATPRAGPPRTADTPAYCNAQAINAQAGRVGRFEVLNDVSGRALRAFRKSPCPPRGRATSPASDDGTSGDRVGRFELLNDVSGRELLNDVSGRALRLFRKSPCPPRARNLAPASDDDASG